MRQASLKIKYLYNNKINALGLDLRKKVFHILLISMGILALGYLFVVGTMISNILERKSLEALVRTMTTEVGDLEIAYLSMSQDVDLNLSKTMGFLEIKPDFATRKTLGQNLPKVKFAQNEI